MLFFSSRRRHTRCLSDWSSDVCSSDLPAIATSTIDRAQAADRIGCVRRFKLKDGSELREQLLALSDLEQPFSDCLLDTPIPMFNYVPHVRLLPVTDGGRTFWRW